MPPKTGKNSPVETRPPIDESSLNYIPEDAVSGYEERIYTGIDWTLEGYMMHHHKHKWATGEIHPVSFTEAYECKLKNSIVGEFLNEDSAFTFEQINEFVVPIKFWEVEKFGNEEATICFQSNNLITDNISVVLQKAVKHNDREKLKKDLQNVTTLRVNDSKMTHLDKTLLQFRRLNILNLCGNKISEFNSEMLPTDLFMLELQANGITTLDGFTQKLPPNLMYLGLARNLLTSGFCESLLSLPTTLTVLDFSENDICELLPVLESLVRLQNFSSLSLVGNPCSVCSGYAVATLTVLPNLKWLDGYDVPEGETNKDMLDPDELRSAYFVFKVIRIMCVPEPPALVKGATDGFHVELELPLLDSQRTQFLMFRRNESLIEFLPPPEDASQILKMTSSINNNFSKSVIAMVPTLSPVETNIYDNMITKDPLEVHHYTTWESAIVPWNNLITFPEPTVRIFCPNLRILRDTFRSAVTVRLVYTQTVTSNEKGGKGDKKVSQTALPQEKFINLATVRCSLRAPVWCQTQQHFHWDSSLGTNDAIHWGDGDLSVLQYGQSANCQPSNAGGAPTAIAVEQPENLTCHFTFGIEMINPE